MKRLLTALVLLTALTGCDSRAERQAVYDAEVSQLKAIHAKQQEGAELLATATPLARLGMTINDPRLQAAGQQLENRIATTHILLGQLQIEEMHQARRVAAAKAALNR
ncbi:MAG: hypothetical protein WC718_17410 [Phycisphaerales bacterium]|jgi:hypothetical protein